MGDFIDGQRLREDELSQKSNAVDALESDEVVLGGRRFDEANDHGCDAPFSQDRLLSF